MLYKLLVQERVLTGIVHLFEVSCILLCLSENQDFLVSIVFNVSLYVLVFLSVALTNYCCINNPLWDLIGIISN